MNNVQRFITSGFFRWGSQSLLGHMVMGALLFGLPLYLIQIYYAVVNQALTLNRFLLGVVVYLVAGAVFGVIMWFTLSRPLIKRKESKDRGSRPL